MDERDQHLLRHLHKNFGTRPFSTREAAESAGTGAGEAEGLPDGEPAWTVALEDLLRRELVLAEVEGWRLTAAILQAASIINI
jgi:hypothetical protein